MSTTKHPATADLCDNFIQSPSRLQIVHPNLFTSFGLKPSFHGKIQTVKCFESNPLVRETLSSPGNGDVLVVDGGGSQRCAIMGDMLATFAVANGWSGVVVNGYIRDSKLINEMDVGVKALGTHPLKSSKEYKGEKNVRVSFGGVEFVPGHYLYSDEDGIVISEEELSMSP
jgi:regulator of ribonuclease activity A